MRSVQRAAAVVLLAVTGVAGAAPAIAAAPATSSRTSPAAPATAAERAPVSLVINSVSPKTAAPSGANSKITLTGRVQNRSGHALPGLTVRLRTSATRMISRTQIAQYAAGSPSWLLGRPAQKAVPGAAATGGQASFSLGTTTGAIGLREFGVYPVGVEVVSQAGQVLAGLNTFITYVPRKRDFKPLSVAWVWPLIDRMHRTSDDSFTDDRLSTDLASSGRLNGLVQAAAATSTPITWAIDPALLDDVQAMANGPYTVRPPRARGEEKSERKPKSTAAAAWLNAVKSASRNDPYFTVPYADPDAVALVRNDMSNHLSFAYRSSSVAGQVLGPRPTVQVAWPPSGMAGQSTLNELAERGRLGDGAFLMSSEAFTDTPQGFTPSATTRLPTEEGAKRTVVYDETLNRIVSGDTRSPGAAVLAEQRFLAETAMITAERPDLARSLVIAPERRWNPAPSFARSLLAHTSSASWMRKTDLTRIADAAPQSRVFRGYPDHLEATELRPGHLDAVSDLSRRATLFTSIMDEPVTLNYQRAVLRMESSSWRGRTRGKRAVIARQSLARRLEADMEGIRVITTGNRRVSLAGSSGRIPITIANNLQTQAVRVRLEISSKRPAQLQVGRLEHKVIELGPEQKVNQWIPVRAAGNGNVDVSVRLLSADGRPLGDAELITVRTTGYGRLALVITGSGLAVLFVGVGVRAMRARRRRKAEAAGDGSTGTGPATAGPFEPGPMEPGPFEPGSFERESRSGHPSGPGPYVDDGDADVHGPFRPPTAPRPGDGPGAGFGASAATPRTPGSGTGLPGTAGLSGATALPGAAGVPGAGSGPSRSGSGLPESGSGLPHADAGVSGHAVVPESARPEPMEPAGFLGAPTPDDYTSPVPPASGTVPGTDSRDGAGAGPVAPGPVAGQPEPGTRPGPAGESPRSPGERSPGESGPSGTTGSAGTDGSSGAGRGRWDAD